MELKAIVLLNITLNPFLNPFYVCIDDSLLAGLALQIFKVRFVVHEIVFTEHCHAWSFSEDIEVFFPVRILVRIVRSDAPAWEVFYCSFVEAVCEGVGLCVAFAGVAAPAGGVHPFGAVAGGVDVEGYQDDVRFAEGLTVGVGASHSF